MRVVEIALLAYVVLAALYWLRMAYGILRMALEIPNLDRLSPTEPAEWPGLSVIVAACNEETTIRPALQSLLDEDYPNLEIVVVNDRSTDGTGRVIDELAAADERVRAVPIRELPPGWLGKVHAMQCGVQQAGGEYLLFTDADVHFRRGTLRKAIAYALEQKADHVAAFPGLEPMPFCLASTVAVFLRGLLVGRRIWAVGKDRSRASMGVGAFNLVRREPFDRAGGLEELRMEVGDDAALGCMMKDAGGRSRIVYAVRGVRLSWYSSLRAMAVGTEKGYGVVCRFSIFFPLALVTAMTLLELGPFLALPISLLVGAPTWLMVAAAALLAPMLLATILPAALTRQSIPAGVCAPVGIIVIAVLMIRTAVLGRRRGGIVWRGTFYPEEAFRDVPMRVRFP
jgi:GT2 family glycosyltransferase